VNLDEIHESLENSEKQLWMISRDDSVVCIAVTEVWKSDAGLVCRIEIASGDFSASLDDMRAIYQQIEDWASGMGCVGVEVLGRRGWAKVLRGFKETGVILEKDLRQVH